MSPDQTGLCCPPCVLQYLWQLRLMCQFDNQVVVEVLCLRMFQPGRAGQSSSVCCKVSGKLIVVPT